MEKKHIIFNQDSLSLEIGDTPESSDTALCVLSFDEIFDCLPEIIKTEKSVSLIQQLILRSYQKITAKGILRDGKNIPVRIFPPRDKRLDCDDAMRKLLLSDLKSMDLSKRTYNCLQAAKCSKVYQSLLYEPQDLLILRNFGICSFTEFENFCKIHAISENISDQLQQHLFELESASLAETIDLMDTNEVKEFLVWTRPIDDLSNRKLGDYQQLGGRRWRDRFKSVQKEMFPYRGPGNVNEDLLPTLYEKNPQALSIGTALTDVEELVRKYLETQLEYFIEG